MLSFSADPYRAGVKFTLCLGCSKLYQTGPVCLFPFWSMWCLNWWCKEVHRGVMFTLPLSLVWMRGDRHLAPVTAFFMDGAWVVTVQLEGDTQLRLENNRLIHWICQACICQKSGMTSRASENNRQSGCEEVVVCCVNVFTMGKTNLICVENL